MTRGMELHTITKGEAKRQVRKAYNEGKSAACNVYFLLTDHFDKQCKY